MTFERLKKVLEKAAKIITLSETKDELSGYSMAAIYIVSGISENDKDTN